MSPLLSVIDMRCFAHCSMVSELLPNHDSMESCFSFLIQVSGIGRTRDAPFLNLTCYGQFDEGSILSSASKTESVGCGLDKELSDTVSGKLRCCCATQETAVKKKAGLQ